jgi:hypothetical protein
MAVLVMRAVKVMLAHQLKLLAVYQRLPACHYLMQAIVVMATSYNTMALYGYGTEFSGCWPDRFADHKDRRVTQVVQGFLDMMAVVA